MVYYSVVLVMNEDLLRVLFSVHARRLHVFYQNIELSLRESFDVDTLLIFQNEK